MFFLSEKKFNECIEIFRSYGIKIDGYESLLKIDKIDDLKITLSYKQKKEFVTRLS